MQEIMLGTVRKADSSFTDSGLKKLTGLMGMTWLEITLKQNRKSKELKEQ